MSNTPPPRSPGETSPGSTRQLLDELDALMQRMLALPVNQLDDDAALPTAPTVRPKPAAEAPPRPEPSPEPTPPSTDAHSTNEPPTARKIVAHPPATIFPQLPHRTEGPTLDKADHALNTPADEPAMIIPPTPEAPPAVPSRPAPPLPVLGPLPRPTTRTVPAQTPAPPRPRVVPYSTQATPTAPPTSRRVPEWLLRPLLWSNRVFDRWTGWLGRPGRWLRGPMGRTVLGWVGLGLWAIVVILLVLRFLR